jgi:hypothetical protein
MALPQLLATACPTPGLARTLTVEHVDAVIDLRGNPESWTPEDITGEVAVAEFTLRHFDDLAVRMWEAAFASDFYLLLWQNPDQRRYLLVLPNDDDLFTEYVVDASDDRHQERHVTTQSEDCEWWEMLYGDWLEEVTNAFPELLGYIIPTFFAKTGTYIDEDRTRRSLRLVETTIDTLTARLQAGDEVPVSEAIGRLGVAGAGYRPSEVPSVLLERHGAISGWFAHQWTTRGMKLGWVADKVIPALEPKQEWELLDSDIQAGFHQGFEHWVSGQVPLLAGIDKTVLGEFFIDCATECYWPGWSPAEIRTVHDLGVRAPTNPWRVLRSGYHRDHVHYDGPFGPPSSDVLPFADYATQWLQAMPLEVAAYYIADGTPVEVALSDYRDGGFDPDAVEMLWALGARVPLPVGTETKDHWLREQMTAEGVRMREQATGSRLR